MTKANVTIELKKGEKYSINDFVGEERGEGLTQKLIYAKSGTIRLNGVKVQGDCVRVGGNLVTVGFVETHDCYEVEYPNTEETRKYLGKSFSMGEPTAELWDTTSNHNALDSLQFTTESGVNYLFVMKEYL